MKKTNLIIGIGNYERGDDGAGLEVARRLATNPPKDWDVSLTDGEPTKLMSIWDGYHNVIAVDAVMTGSAPIGSIFKWDASTTPLPAEHYVSSSHALGLCEAIELARILKRLPARIQVIGIEGGSYDYSTHISPAVEKAVEMVVKNICEER